MSSLNTNIQSCTSAKCKILLLFDIGIKLGFAKSNFGFISIFAIFIGIYFKDYLNAYLPSGLSVGILAFGIFAGAVTVFNSEIKFNRSIIFCLVICILWLLTSVATNNFNFNNYYIAIPLAALIVNVNGRLFLKLVVIFAFASFVVQFYEYKSNHYLFDSLDSTGNVLNKELFSGGLDIIRTKGLTQGPLSSVSLWLWIVILSWRNIPAALILIVSSFLSGGRLGIILGLLLLLVGFIFPVRLKSLFLSVFLIFIIWIAFYIVQEQFETTDMYQFVMSAFDINNQQTQNRFLVWNENLSLYNSYDLTSMIFGAPMVSKLTIGGTENDYLGILVENGFLCLLVYIYSIFIMAVKFWKNRDVERLSCLMIIVLCSMLFPFIQSIQSTVIYWVYFFALINNKIYYKQQIVT